MIETLPFGASIQQTALRKNIMLEFFHLRSKEILRLESGASEF
jgi:hypothetical protein